LSVFVLFPKSSLIVSPLTDTKSFDENLSLFSLTINEDANDYGIKVETIEEQMTHQNNLAFNIINE
jgi:hypothetical protein